MEELVLNRETRGEIDGSFIELSSGWTHYELSGPENGPRLVLIHGNAAPMVSWDNNVGALRSAGYRVLRYDLFGHGFSDRPKLDVYNKSLYDLQLVELCSMLGFEKPLVIAGTSQGGSIAAHFAASHPGRVQKLVLLSPYFDEFNGKLAVRLLRSGLGKLLMASAREKSFADPSRGFVTDLFTEELEAKLRQQLRYEGKKRAVRANLLGDALGDFSEVYRDVVRQNIPVFLSWGDHDASIPLRSISRLRRIIPEAEYHQIGRAAHLLHYELPEIINPLILNFLRG